MRVRGVGHGKRQMGRSRLPDTEPSSVEDAGTELRGAALFKLIWDAVSDVVGTTAAATLLRRGLPPDGVASSSSDSATVGPTAIPSAKHGL